MAIKIPQKDIKYGMPIRWAFHIWCCNGKPSWKFDEWRNYLLNWDHGGLDILPELFNKNPVDPTFFNRTKQFLKDNNARTLVGFIKFYSKCLNEYKKCLK